MTGDLIAAQSPIYALEQARQKLTVRQMLARNPKSTSEASGPEVGASLIEHGHVSLPRSIGIIKTFGRKRNHSSLTIGGVWE